ncbi:ankyrin repeat domain-containing protein 2B-like protein [Tanacetum coccineum]
MHTTMVPEQVKTMKIQAGIQVSRPRELTRQLQLWKRFGRLYLIVFVLVRNIYARCIVYYPSRDDGDIVEVEKPLHRPLEQFSGFVSNKDVKNVYVFVKKIVQYPEPEGSLLLTGLSTSTKEAPDEPKRLLKWAHATTGTAPDMKPSRPGSSGKFLQRANHLKGDLDGSKDSFSTPGGLIANPTQKDQLEERMAKIKEDPSLKHILEDIEIGSPTAMMRYWNDKDVLAKLGEAMGLPVTGDSTPFVGNSGAGEAEEVNENESIVHQTATTGDVEGLKKGERCALLDVWC